MSATVAEFQELIYRLNLFSTMDVPYQEWHPMVVELFAALQQMADTGRLSFKSKEFHTAEQIAAEVLRRLASDPEYNQRVIDLLNGAL